MNKNKLFESVLREFNPDWARNESWWGMPDWKKAIYEAQRVLDTQHGHHNIEFSDEHEIDTLAGIIRAYGLEAELKEELMDEIGSDDMTGLEEVYVYIDNPTEDWFWEIPEGAVTVF